MEKAPVSGIPFLLNEAHHVSMFYMKMVVYPWYVSFHDVYSKAGIADSG